MESPELTNPQAVSHEAQKHTDSMVTVPLSDVLSNSEDTQPGWKSIEIPQTPVENDLDPESPADVDNEASALTPKSISVESEIEQAPSVEDGASVRSRSSDGSQRSVDPGEAETNWAELEKTEAQESREEGSDEVYPIAMRLDQD